MIRKNKKGIIEIQFNWIFVLIAGFIIFLFIISIINSQKKQSDQTLNIDIMSLITTEIKNKQQIFNSYNEIHTTSVYDLQFSCDKDTKQAGIYIKGTEGNIELPTEVLFTTTKLSTNNIIIWTSDFSTPFTVTRFMFITSPGTAFLIYNDSANQYAKQIYYDLPANITKIYVNSFAPDISSSSILKQTKAFKNYHIICFDDDCPANKYNYLRITPSPDNGLYSYGDLAYHRAGVPTDALSKYVTKSSLFGAIFSDSRDFYECEVARAYDQMNLKGSLHLTRMKLLTDNPDIDPDCVTYFAGPQAILSDMKSLSIKDVSTLYADTNELSMDNRNLEDKGCSQIY